MPEPTEEEVLAGTPLRKVSEPTLQEVTEVPAATRTRAPRASKEGVAVVAEVTEVSMIGDDDSGNDVVNEIFATTS